MRGMMLLPTVIITMIVSLSDLVHCNDKINQRYPLLLDFVDDYVGHYSYNEIYIVVYKKDRKLLESVARALFRGRVEATTTVLRPSDDTEMNATLSVFPTEEDQPYYDYQHLPHVYPRAQISRRPIFMTTDEVVLELQQDFEWTVAHASHSDPWLLICQESTSLLGNDLLFYPLDNKITIATWTNLGAEELVNINLWEVYQPSEDLPQRTLQVGFWNESLSGTQPPASPTPPVEEASPEGNPKAKGEVSPQGYSFPDANVSSRRTDLSGLHIRCLTETWQPFTDNVVVDDGSDVIIGGIMGESLKLMSEILNFTYSCQQSQDHLFGDKNNGSWTGLVGELLDNNGDVIVAPLDDTFERSQDIDFVVPTGTITYDLIIRRPEPKTMTNFSRVLQPKAWHAYLLMVFITCALYMHFTFFNRSTRFRAIFDGAFDVLTIHLSQVTLCMRGPGTPRRIYLLTMVITAGLVLEFYTADLMSFLTITAKDPPIRSMAELLKHETYKLGVQHGNSEVERLRNATDATLQRVWTEVVMKDPSNIVPSSEEGFRKVMEEEFVFLTDGIYFQYHNSKNCSIMQVGARLFKYGAGMAVRKHSPLRAILNYQILQQQSSGLLSRLINNFKPPKADCFARGAGQLGLTPLIGAFVIVIVGVVVSLSIFIAEMSSSRDRDTDARLFTPADRRLMTLPFQEAIKSLGYIYDKNKGLVFKNHWFMIDIIHLLDVYKKLSPKHPSITNCDNTLWRKVGLQINRHPNLCHKKFKQLLTKYALFKTHQSREARMFRKKLYYKMLEQLIEHDQTHLLKQYAIEGAIASKELYDGHTEEEDDEEEVEEALVEELKKSESNSSLSLPKPVRDPEPLSHGTTTVDVGTIPGTVLQD